MKKLIFPLLVLLLLPVSCGRKEQEADVKAFLTHHYSMKLDFAQELQSMTDMPNLVRARYEDQPVSQRCVDTILTRSMCTRLSHMAMDAQADVAVTLLTVELTSQGEGIKSYGYTVTVEAGRQEQTIQGSLSVTEDPIPQIDYIREYN